MDRETYRRRFGEEDAPGRDAIEARLAEIYRGGAPDFRFGTPHPYALGGPDPLDGFSLFGRADPEPHLHYVSYGMSELYYAEEAAGGGSSGWGFEFSFRLRLAEEAPEEPPNWPRNLMQNLARYAHQSARGFGPLHFIHANGPIKAESDTALVGLLFVEDPELGAIDTPHGRVAFLQMVGLTEREIRGLIDQRVGPEALAAWLAEGNPLLITDLERRRDAPLG